jgi:hypothetical protein
MKFVVFVEGETEKCLREFFNKWLEKQSSLSLRIKTVKFNGWSDFERKTPKKAEMYLNSKDKDDIIAIIGLLDLYGPEFYPDSVTSKKDRIKWGTKHIEDAVNNKKFKMFFAVHELEAWLLSQPENLPSSVRKALPKKLPEDVNFDEPPAKLLKRLYHNKENIFYKKTTHSVDLFKKLDPDIAYQKCPYLKTMLKEMLELARVKLQNG